VVLKISPLLVAYFIRISFHLLLIQICCCEINRNSDIRVRIYFVFCISLNIRNMRKTLQNQLYTFRTQFLRIYQFSHASYIHLPSHLSSFYHTDNIWWSTQFSKILIFQINQPTRCTNLSALLPVVKYSSTCFGHPHAHHQELINCSSRLWFTVGTWW